MVAPVPTPDSAARWLAEHAGADVDVMTGTQFESCLATMFTFLGYAVEITETYDFGADLIVTKDGIRSAVQAKRQEKRMGEHAVQQAVTGRVSYQCDTATVVTNAEIQPRARALAARNRGFDHGSCASHPHVANGGDGQFSDLASRASVHAVRHLVGRAERPLWPVLGLRKLSARLSGESALPIHPDPVAVRGRATGVARSTAESGPDTAGVMVPCTRRLTSRSAPISDRRRDRADDRAGVSIRRAEGWS